MKQKPINTENPENLKRLALGDWINHQGVVGRFIGISPKNIVWIAWAPDAQQDLGWQRMVNAYFNLFALNYPAKAKCVWCKSDVDVTRYICPSCGEFISQIDPEI